jgi:hypothetical protein
VTSPLIEAEVFIVRQKYRHTEEHFDQQPDTDVLLDHQPVPHPHWRRANTITLSRGAADAGACSFFVQPCAPLSGSLFRVSYDS